MRWQITGVAEREGLARAGGPGVEKFREDGYMQGEPCS